MAKLVLLSDTHNKLSQLDVPAGDILIHAGDMCGHGNMVELERFAAEFSALPHPHKVCIAGNHDFVLEKHRFLAQGVLLRAGISYLQDEEVTVAGLRIYGSPWQPRFCDWAFNLDRGEPLRRVWRNIPTGVDVLVTHGPPMGILDVTPSGEHVGCEDLAAELARVRPQLHVFGHIHPSYGKVERDGTLYVNASNLNERYNPTQKPQVVELLESCEQALNKTQQDPGSATQVSAPYFISLDAVPGSAGRGAVCGPHDSRRGFHADAVSSRLVSSACPAGCS